MITNTANGPPTAARGGFDDNVYGVVENALSLSEGQPQPAQQYDAGTGGRCITYGQSLQNLKRLQEDANTWTCPPILLHVAESYESDGILQIDVAETIGEGQNVPSPEKRTNDNCYWFAKIFNTNTDEFREKKLVPEIKAACREAGFTVNCKHNKMENGNGRIEVKCCRGRYHSEEKSRAHNRKKARTAKSNAAPKERQKKTMKPVHGQDGNDTRCPFLFQIYWDEKRKRWFLPKKQRGNRMHCGHKPIDPADIKLETKNSISAAEKEVAKDSLQSHISTAATQTQNLIRTRTGQTLPAEAFRERYVDICNFAESAGDDGIAVMAKHFAHCQRRFLNFFNNSTNSEDEVAAPTPPTSGSTLYARFNDPFLVICQMAQRTGEAGIAAVSEELLACQQELVGLVDGK